MKWLKTMYTHLIGALKWNKYHQKRKSQAYYGYISIKIAKWAKRVNTQTNYAVCKPSDTIATLSFLQNFKSAWKYSRIHRGAPMAMLQYLMEDPTKAVLVHVVVLQNVINFRKKESTASVDGFSVTC